MMLRMRWRWLSATFWRRRGCAHVGMSTYEDLLRLPETLSADRLLLIDGHSLAYRSYYGMPDLTTPEGSPIGAVYGFWRVLLTMMRAYPAQHTAVAFDCGGHTFRHEVYAEYKANRSPMPDDLRVQMPEIERMLSNLGIPVFLVTGVEADDVLASLAAQAAERGVSSLIASSDKDLAQVVADRVALLRPTGRGGHEAFLRMDAEAVEERFGVPPERIVDLLALVGDTSDNVPGVPAVGEKTARKLLQEFGSLDLVLSHAAEVKNRRISENLVTHADEARRARRLIQLKTDIDLGDVLNVCRVRGADLTALSHQLRELGFVRALQELGVGTVVDDAPSDKPLIEARYESVMTTEALDRLLQRVQGCRVLSIDLETTGKDPHCAEIVGFAISPEPHVGYYIPVGHRSLVAPKQLDREQVLDALRPILESAEREVIGQNIKYDLILLSRHRVFPPRVGFDAMIASHLTDPEERRHNLERIAGSVLGETVTGYADVVGPGETFADVEVEDATRYAAEDAEIVQRLRPPLMQRLSANRLTQLFDDVEMPLVSVLVRMERNGILLDRTVLANQGAEIRKDMELLEFDLMEMAGEAFNPNSPKQVAEILFQRLGLPVVARTKTGPSTSAQVLSKLAEIHPLPGKLMAHRELQKLLSTYIEQLPKSVHPETGRIHTTFHQTATATGRLSSSDPNLQNIPTRTEIGGRIRNAFVAERGYRLVSADYSQIELRLLAHFSQDPELLAGFDAGADLHRRTASNVFGLPEKEVPDSLREAAKRINFGILYGISPYGLARDLGIPQAEAKAYIDRFFHTYPRVKETIDQLIRTATEQGWAETLLGRRRPLPHLTSRNVQQRNYDRRNAVNTPIQGSAADLIKMAMIRIDRRIREEMPSVRMTLQIHD
ncbi:MAG TPA: DNA polymerase I, partial [Candidatus Acetothermia bacterium]|nr:DNA polymerase I [Candidatus Acetothermia bacterium]